MSESERPPADPLREAAKEAADYLRAIGSVTLADRIDAALASPAAPEVVRRADLAVDDDPEHDFDGPDPWASPAAPRPTPRPEGLDDPWQWLHDNEFSWDDVNAIAAILDHGGFDIVRVRLPDTGDTAALSRNDEINAVHAALDRLSDTGDTES